MRLPRMTTRRWMIAVATLAALLAAFEAGRRWERYRGLAPRYASYRTRIGRHRPSTIRTYREAQVSQDSGPR
jgi:hypothetical protein